MSLEQPTVDEVLAAPLDYLGLPEGAVPVHVIVLVEVANPGDADEPVALFTVADDGLAMWQAVGMLAYADVIARAGLNPPPEG